MGRSRIVDGVIVLGRLEGSKGISGFLNLQFRMVAAGGEGSIQLDSYRNPFEKWHSQYSIDKLYNHIKDMYFGLPLTKIDPSLLLAAYNATGKMGEIIKGNADHTYDRNL